MINTVGSQLRLIRKNRGESIVEVAKATHTSPASFTKWENDQTVPSERSIRKLADYYQTDPLEILALAYPDKYATETPDALTGSDANAIALEELLQNKTVLTYQDQPLPGTTKSLIAAFVAGLVISQPV